MRHLKKGKKFGRKRGPRKAFLKILAGNFIKNGKMVTTLARAKELKPLIDRLLTHAKKQNVAGLRLLMEKLPKSAAYKLYHEIAPRYKDRQGGYTRIIKQARARLRDGAKMAVIEFI